MQYLHALSKDLKVTFIGMFNWINTQIKEIVIHSYGKGGTKQVHFSRM